MVSFTSKRSKVLVHVCKKFYNAIAQTEYLLILVYVMYKCQYLLGEHRHDQFIVD